MLSKQTNAGRTSHAPLKWLLSVLLCSAMHTHAVRAQLNPLDGLTDVAPVAAPGTLPATQQGVPSTPPSTLPPPVLGIGTPRHGVALYETSGWYDPINQAIAVSGGASDIPAALIASGNYQIILNGQYPATILAASAASGRIRFEGQVPAVDQPAWVKYGVLAELIDTTTSAVIARDTVNYFDLRDDDDASPDTPYKPIRGMAAQFTDTGVGQSSLDTPTSLEMPLLQSLPYPSIGDFNNALTSLANQIPVDEGESGLNACINLADAVALEPRLNSTTEYLAMKLIADGFYAAYEAFDNSGTCEVVSSTLSGIATPLFGLIALAGCETAMKGFCVRERPQLEDFQLCVNELQGNATSLMIDSVSDVTLEFTGSTPAQIASGYNVTGVDGRLDGLLRGLSYRWANESCTAPPPETRISDTRLINKDWLQDLTTCEDIAIEAETAVTSSTGHALYQVDVDSRDDEALRVTLAEGGELELISPEASVDQGLCGESFLIDDADALALSYQHAFEDVLNEAWNGVGPVNHQAEALQLLFDSFNLGVAPRTLYSLDAVFDDRISSNERGGMELAWSTEVLERLKEGGEIAPDTDTFFLQPALDPPFHKDGRNIDSNERFDVSFTLTTGYLNQLLHMQSKTLLESQFEPTWDNLSAVGVSAPPGASDDQIAILDGNTLGQIDPSFAVLGATGIDIQIKPSLDPVIWMHPDPPAFMWNSVSGAPLAYGISGLDIRFIENAEGVQPGREWLHAELSFIDTDVSLTMGLNEPNVISLQMVNDQWGLAVKSTLFNGCPMVPHGNWEPAASCERTLEQGLVPLFKNLLRPRFVAMLSDIPAPQVFEAAAGSAVFVDTVANRSLWQLNQNITFYRDIPPNF